MNLSVGNPRVQMSDGILYVRGFIKCCRTNPEDNGAEKEHSLPCLFWGGGGNKLSARSPCKDALAVGGEGGAEGERGTER